MDHNWVNSKRTNRGFRKVYWTTLSFLGSALIALPATGLRTSILLYNPSQSAPQGWYRIEPLEHVVRGDEVVSNLPQKAAEFASQREYLPRGIPVIKTVAALEGDTVCDTGGVLEINDAPGDLRFCRKARSPVHRGAEPVVYRTYTPTIVSGAVPGQLKPMPTKTETPSLKPYQAIEAANGKAAIEPSLDNYLNAIQVYPYTVGALYQVYCAPEQVTDIVLQPGEELVSVSAGDTVRWVLGDTVSGTGVDAQAHILIKPTQAGLKTNLIITTSLRAYHLELRAFEDTYMAAVSWRYADQQLVTRVVSSGAARASAPSSPAGLQLDRLKFRYDIDGDAPHWRPRQVFDDGRKVYIQFPARLDQGEAPAMFVIGRDGKSQLVNYRMSGDYYVVDRLFARAELRLGEKRQDVVKIARNDLGASKP